MKPFAEGGYSSPPGLEQQATAFQASAWPTPTARDGKGANQHEAHDRGTKGPPLNEVAALWQTPNLVDAKGGNRLGEGQAQLCHQTAQWSTPSVADVQGGRMTRSGDRSNEPLLNGQSDSLSSHLALATYPVGGLPSKERRSLNPLFVEWLMGWPPGWTLLAWTDFACSATELSRFKQRMRSALSSLGSPAEAPPAQMSLFG